MANRVTTVFDLDSKGFDSGLKTLRTKVADADGAFGKLKAGASGLFDSIKANSAAAAVAAGTALVAIGTKGVQAFEDTAIAAGKMADATGLSTDAASRWLEIADDVGVSGETITTSFVKLNKELAGGSATADKYGIALQHTADGAVDVNATMLEAIKAVSAIRDPTERAAAAQTLFGKSYKDAAELLLNGSAKVKQALQGVGSAQVISDKELEKARKFRATMDNLSDAGQSLAINLGSVLIPAIQAVVTYFDKVSSAGAKVVDFFDRAGAANRKMTEAWDASSEAAANFDMALLANADSVADVRAKVIELTGDQTAANIVALEWADANHLAAGQTKSQAQALDTLTNQSKSYVDLLTSKGIKALNDVAEATNRARKANKLLADSQRDVREETISSLGSMFDYEEATMATATAVQALADANFDDLRPAQIEAAKAALSQAQAFAQSKGAIDGSVLSAQLQIAEFERMAAQFPQLKTEIQNYINALNGIPSVKSTQLVITSKGAVTTKQTQNQFGRLVGGATGGIVTRPTMALIGEAGPEAVVPLSSTPGSSPMPASGMWGGGGSTYNVTVNAGINADGPEISRVVVAALKRQERFAGPLYAKP